MIRVAAAVAVLAVTALGLAGCRAASDGAGRAVAIRVLAAASLTEALGPVVEQFEAANDGVEVEVSFGASSALAEQVGRGADADVLITADEATMDGVRSAGELHGDALVIARNRMTLVVEQGNPTGVRSIDDLARDDLVVVLCAPEVPCGSIARRLLEANDVEVEPASLEENVKGVLSKVALGEADAGIVYETDAQVAVDDTDAIEILRADESAFEAVYPAAVLRASRRRDAARRFVEHLSTDDAQRELVAAGFRRP